MEKIRWAIIGAGGIADRRAIPALLLDPQNEIVAVMDRVTEVSAQVAEKYNVKNHFDDVETMLKTVPCDAVYIATPVFCHYEQAMLALKYGCHTFIEKPLAMTESESAAILAAYKKEKKQLTVGYMMSYHNLHKKAKDIIKKGGIGDVVSARFQFDAWYPEVPGAWRQKKSLGGGGCIMDLAVHCIELFTRITGEEISEVKAFYGTQTFSYEVEDSAVIIFRSEKGTLGMVDVYFNVPDNAAPTKFEIYGTKGSLTAEGTLGQEETGKLKYIYAPQDEYDAQQSKSIEKPKTYRAKGENIYTKQFADFNKLLKKSKTNYNNAKYAVKIQGLCDKIYADDAE